MTKFFVGTAALILVFVAGRSLASKDACARVLTPVVLPGEKTSILTDPPRMDVGAISVGEGPAYAPTLARITVMFGPRDQDVWYASGSVILDDVVLTATHTLPRTFDKAKDHIFVDCGGQRIPGTLLYHDRGQEVMLIGASCGHANVELDTQPLDWDEKLVFAGFNFTFKESEAGKRLESAISFSRPTSFIPSANLGTDESRFEEPARRVYLEIRRRHLPEPFAITGAMVRGNSGGPVYRKATGGVVGIAIIMDTEYDRTFVVPAVTIQTALHQAGLLK
jgi:hypothetical protein